MSYKQPDGSPIWTFLTNHAHALVCLAQNPESRVRDIAELVGITERAAVRILNDLEADGFIVRTRDGRRNSYELRDGSTLRHPLESSCTISDLLRALVPQKKRPKARRGSK